MDHIAWLELHSTGLGKKIRYRLDINAEDFRGRAGVVWLIMAANPHLSLDELCAVMEEAFGCYRPRSWVWRRRWIFLDPANVRKAGGASALVMRGSGSKKSLCELSTRSRIPPRRKTPVNR